MNFALKVFRYALAAGTLLGPAATFAAQFPIVATDLESFTVRVLCPILDYLFTIALIIGIVMALVAAFKYLTSGGDPNKVTEAHKTLTYAAVGLAVAILAGSLPILVGSLLGWPAVSEC